MDLLKDAAKNINLYDVKAYVRKAQNVAMNLTEMEAKVREATNNEPWGAPSTLMAQIAAGTYNYREREEIISFIFRRFTEKAANEWRQIYKSLQLLDYLIRNGSERIIDDVRANLLLIQMLKSFHYIDSKGRDQGINVRNRAKNLISLLNDDAQIRAERKKARNNSKKFGGVSSAAYGGASSITTGASGDEDFTNRVFGDGGVYGARYGDSAEEYNKNQAANSNSNDNFEEYEVSTAPKTRSSRPTTGSSSATAISTKSKPQPAEPDLLADLDFGSSSQAPAAAQDDDDEFDDFQSAPTQNTQSINNLGNLYQPQPQAQVSQPATSGFGQPQTFSQPAPVNRVSSKSDDAFSSLFSSAKTKSSSRTPSGATPAATSHAAPATPAKDDFFGDFSSQPAPAKPANGNGEVDLLDL